MSVSSPQELVGKLIQLVACDPRGRQSEHSIMWLVVGFGSGQIRLQATNSGHKSATDWRELRDDIEAGRLEVV